MRPKLGWNSGFTILETIVVVGVSGTILAAALPNLMTVVNAAQLLAATRSSAQFVRLARSVAIGKNLQSRVVVSENGSTLTTQVNRNYTWTNTGTPLVLTNGMIVSSISPSASALSFTSQGTTSGTVTIVLRDSGGHTKSLVVSILGSVDLG